MDHTNYRVLIVDDEFMIRRLTQRALMQQGFECDTAADGAEAEEMVATREYDVVVTDLCMPKKNGHALSVGLLARKNRPLIFVLTGIAEPRLAKDLLLRGVDDIVSKPVDFATFAVKVRAFAERRARCHGSTTLSEQISAEEPGPTGDLQLGAPKQSALKGASDQTDKAPQASPVVPTVTSDRLRQQLERASELIRISPATLHVYRLVNDSDLDALHFAAVISRNEQLTNELLQLANSSFYNPEGTDCADLEQAVIRISHKRVGQLALAANAMAATLAKGPEWLDAGLFWRRSAAAGVAIERLITQGGHRPIEDGLVLCAAMYSMGRFLLGNLFSEEYLHAVNLCRDRQESLVDYEHRIFPRSQSESMLDVLSTWGIPSSLSQPLKFASYPFEELGDLPEPLRSKTELVKVADLLARLALGGWEPWDSVDLPSQKTLERLRVSSVQVVLDTVKANLAGINPLGQPRTPAPGNTPKSRHCYWKAIASGFDFVVELLRLEYNLRPLSQAEVSAEPILINCFDTRIEDISWARRTQANDLIICDRSQLQQLARQANTLALPASNAAVHAAISQLSLPT